MNEISNIFIDPATLDAFENLGIGASLLIVVLAIIFKVVVPLIRQKNPGERRAGLEGIESTLNEIKTDTDIMKTWHAPDDRGIQSWRGGMIESKLDDLTGALNNMSKSIDHQVDAITALVAKSHPDN